MITNIVAFDLETEAIPERQRVFAKSGRSIYVSQYEPPRPVVMAVADAGGVYLDSPDNWETLISRPVVGHNVSFDITVLMYHYPSARARFIGMANRGQVFDTMILDWLLRLAKGEFDYPVYDPDTGWAVPRSETRSLAACAKDYLGIDLPKDESIRLTYGQFLGKHPTELPEEHQLYARQDAVVTYKIFHEQLKRLDDIAYPRGTVQHYPNSDKNLLSHHIHLRASLVAAAMDTLGVHCNQEEAGRLRDMFMKDLGPIETKLVTYGLGRYKPVPKAPRDTTKLPPETEAHDWKAMDEG